MNQSNQFRTVAPSKDSVESVVKLSMQLHIKNSTKRVQSVSQGRKFGLPVRDESANKVTPRHTIVDDCSRPEKNNFRNPKVIHVIKKQCSDKLNGYGDYKLLVESPESKTSIVESTIQSSRTIFADNIPEIPESKQLLESSDFQLNFGREIALSTCLHANPGSLTIDLKSGHTSIQHQIAHRTRYRQLFRMVDLNDMGSYKNVLYGSRIWLLVEPGSGDPDWKHGSVLGSRIHKPSSAPKARLYAIHSQNTMQIDNNESLETRAGAMEGVLFPVSSAFPGINRDGRASNEFSDSYMRIKNIDALSVAHWLIKPVGENGFFLPEKIGKAVCNNDYCYLEQNFYYLCYNPNTSDTQLSELNFEKDGPTVKVEGIFRIQTTDEIDSRGQDKEKASLASKAVRQLQFSADSRKGRRCYVGNNETIHGGEEFLKEINKSIDRNVIESIMTSVAPAVLKEERLDSWFDKVLVKELEKEYSFNDYNKVEDDMYADEVKLFNPLAQYLQKPHTAPGSTAQSFSSTSRAWNHTCKHQHLTTSSKLDFYHKCASKESVQCPTMCKLCRHSNSKYSSSISGGGFNLCEINNEIQGQIEGKKCNAHGLIQNFETSQSIYSRDGIHRCKKKSEEQSSTSNLLASYSIEKIIEKLKNQDQVIHGVLRHETRLSIEAGHQSLEM